jgi:peroxiredoxin
MTAATMIPQTNVYRSVLGAGTQAPEFTLQCTPDQTVSLNEFRERPVVLAFYPADFSPVCGDQMALYNEMLDEFQAFQAELFGISVDGVSCHAAFARKNNLRFPLLADFEPKGAVAGAYGVTTKKTECANAPFSSSTPTGSFTGAMFRRWALIPEQTESCLHSKILRQKAQ